MISDKLIEFAIASIGTIVTVSAVAIWRISQAWKRLENADKQCAEVPVLKERIQNNEHEIQRLRDWKHDHVAPTLQRLCMSQDLEYSALDDTRVHNLPERKK